MKASFFNQHGGSEKIEYGDQSVPRPKSDEVLLRVRSCSVNHLDIWVRNGIPAYPVKFPHILGADISGEIAEIPSQLSSTLASQGLKEGSPVVVAPGLSCWNCPECKSGDDHLCGSYKIIGAAGWGGYAEFVTVPAKNLFLKPDHLSFEESASFPLTFLTAWHMLVTRAGLKRGDKVLIVGAGSGIGSAAIQIVKIMDGIAIAVSSSDEKLIQAKKIGADYVVDGSEADFSKTVLEITGGKGVDIVFEHVGPATWEKSIASLALRGRLVICGGTTGPQVSVILRNLFMKELMIFGSKMGTRAEFEKVMELVNQKRLRPVISKIFSLSEAGKAHDFLENRKQFGKVVLKVL